MYKLNLAILALLCLVLTSCEKESLDSSDQSDLQLSVRSADHIIVSYDTSTATGQTATCNRADVYFLSTTWADLVLTNSNSTNQVVAKNIVFSEVDGNELLATDSNGIEHLAYGFLIDPCNSELCLDYGENVFGSLSFIIEDDPSGF